MVKDPLYTALKNYINNEQGTTIHDIFRVISKSRLAKDSGINLQRLNRKIAGPDKFSTRDIIILSDLIGCETEKLFKLIERSVDKKSLRKKKKA